MKFLTTIPAGPSTNNMYRSIGSGRVLKSEKYREWLRDSVDDIIMGGDWNADPIATMVKMEILVHPKDKRLRDIDNYAKACADLMEAAGVIIDDRQIVKLTIERGEFMPDHMVTISIKTCSA